MADYYQFELGCTKHEVCERIHTPAEDQFGSIDELSARRISNLNLQSLFPGAFIA